MSTTSVCFGIAKVQCQKLNIIEYFLLSYMPMHDMLNKRKNMQRKIKSKKNQNIFKYSCKSVSRRCESYKMYLKSDSHHQAVMIVCKLN